MQDKQYIWKSKKWNFYWVWERNIKAYYGLNPKKKRVVLVISNAQSLLDRALIIQCSTKQQNINSIFLGSIEYMKGNEKIIKESYAMPDRLLTIPSRILTIHNKINQPKPSKEARDAIISFLQSYIEKDPE